MKGSKSTKKAATTKDVQRLRWFWTDENPQVMMTRHEEYGKQLCREIIGLNSEYDHDDLTQKIEDLILQYRAMAEGIEQWWKYTHEE